MDIIRKIQYVVSIDRFNRKHLSYSTPVAKQVMKESLLNWQRK